MAAPKIHTEAATMKTRALQATSTLLINAAIFTLLTGFADLLLGSHLKQKPPASKVPGALYAIQRQYELPERVWGAFAEKEVKYSRDYDGYRGKQREKGKFILAIGGSTTDERYVDDAKTWSEAAEKTTNAITHEDYDFINGGVDGQSTWGHLYSIKEWHSKALPKESVEMVVFYVGYNDARLLADPRASTPFDNPDLSRRIHNYLSTNSFVYSRLLQLYHHHFSGLHVNGERRIEVVGHQPRTWEFLSNPISEEKGQPPKQSNSLKNWQEYEMLFSSLIQETIKAFPNARIAIVQQYIPGCLFKRDETLNRLGAASAAKQECQALKKVFELQENALKIIQRAGAEHTKVALIEMQSGFNAPDSGFYDEIHSNSQGSSAIGIYIGKKISNLLLSAYKRRATTASHTWLATFNPSFQQSR